MALRISRPNSKEIAVRVFSQLKGIGGYSQNGFCKDRVMSLADAIAKALAEDLALNGSSQTPEQVPLDLTQSNGGEKMPLGQMHISATADLCPECGTASFVLEEGFQTCYSCGYSKC